MREVHRWLAILMLLCAPTVAIAQGTAGVRDQVRDPAHDNVAVDETAGWALPRFAGGTERNSRAQRAIFVMLVTLLTATAILGVATIAHAFRDQAGRRRRH